MKSGHLIDNTIYKTIESNNDDIVIKQMAKILEKYGDKLTKKGKNTLLENF